jgi:hypothetical protein
VINHPIEKRGIIGVPLDYSKPESGMIQIFYRLIPAYGSNPSDTSKPIAVVFNGGPGIPSHVYRPLNFNYENPDSEENGPFDRFKFILKTHHVLIADQRGTDGQSTPLDLTAEGLHPHAVAQYFSSDSQARDYAAVIETIIPPHQPFFIIAQSYGGMVGMQYLCLDTAPKPSNIFFTCSALPYEDVIEAMLGRRQEQYNLNQSLKTAYPQIEQTLEQLKQRLEQFGIHPKNINALYSWLGKSEAGRWENAFVEHLQKLLQSNQETLEKKFQNEIGVGNVLNYILSSPNFTPGFTDRTLAQLTSDRIPFEPWMLDENWILLQIGQGNPNTERLISEMDRLPPPRTPFLPEESIRQHIKKQKVIFVSADNDAYVPAETYKKAYQKFWVEGYTFKEHLPGGHHAIFLEAGHRAILEWTRV